MNQEKQAIDGAPTVRRRKVFYIPGYDPFPPRRYRELYRKEGEEQAELSGYEINLRPKTGPGRYGWHVDADIGGTTRADFEVLVWSDLVRDSMRPSIAGTYLMLLRTAYIYISSGALRRLSWLRKGPVIAALYPVAALIGQLILAMLAGKAVAVVLRAFIEWILPAWLSNAIGWAAFAAVVVVILQWFRRLDHKFFAYYLMHDYYYSARLGGANPPELEARMAEFTDTIAAAMTDTYDEVLVVGHSSGAHLAVSILADLICAGRVPKTGPALAFLSLGEVIPMVSFLPKATRLRADLHFLSQRPEITWVDVTAPGDGCCFALCDPVAVTGVAPDNQRWPLIISAAFTQSLSAEVWQRLRWRFFRLHFQYLCAFDRPKDYDYFQITAGPITLNQRYRERVSSRSRIDVAASPHTSMEP